MEKQKHFFTVDEYVNQLNHCGRQYGASSRTQKQKFHLTQQSHYCVFTQRIINHSIVHTCTCMFIVALFTIAKTWNQPKCPSMIDWIKKTWHMYTTEYQAAIKRDEFMSFAGTWLNLETVILGKLTQERKIKHRMFSLISGC